MGIVAGRATRGGAHDDTIEEHGIVCLWRTTEGFVRVTSRRAASELVTLPATPRTDNHTPEQRSRTMSRIRSSDTGPELALRRALWRRGLRGYRLHLRSLPGKPDVAWSRYKVAVFVDGAFWHGHPSAFKSGKSGAYWDTKIARNIERDQAATLALEALGWRVLRLWDFQLKADLEGCIAQIDEALAASAKRGAVRAGAADPS